MAVMMERTKARISEDHHAMMAPPPNMLAMALATPEPS